MNAIARQAVRDAVKEASVRSKAHRERWSVGRTMVDPEGTRHDSSEVAWQGLVDADAADLFVDVMVAALGRYGLRIEETAR